MTEEERFLFDLQGYLILENVIDPSVLAEMNGWLDAQAERDPAFRGGQGNDHLPHPITWGPLFRNLMDHHRTLPILRELLGPYLRLDHDYAIFLQPGGPGLPLHGPNGDPYDPIHYYHCRDGRIYSGLTVATFALTDVPADSGGLAVIPGSHKSHFNTPEEIRKFQRRTPIVRQVPMKAGDVAIFTEALVHGTLPWTGPGVRRTLFFKYAPNGIAWEKNCYLPTEASPAIRALESELTDRQHELMQPPSAPDHRTRI